MESIKIRQDFGDAIREFRTKRVPTWSQEFVCDKVNRIVQAKGSLHMLYQKKLSRIERGDTSIVLTEQTIHALQQICELPREVVTPYLNMMNHISNQQKHRHTDNVIYIEDYEQLLADPHHSEFKGYSGTYYCYYHSTDAMNPKIVQGKLVIGPADGIICPAEIRLYDGKKVIKEYFGQFFLNRHYQMWYCILIGREKQEICFLLSNHFNSTIEKNQFNIALALTTSAGMQKRPTMHRMLISRSKIDKNTLSVIHSQLMLNTDTIMISEENLQKLEDSIVAKMQHTTKLGAQDEAVISCINYIKTNIKKKAYYQIDEAIIYDTATITEDVFLRGYAVSTLRNHSEGKFFNKLSQTVHNICFNLIHDQGKN